MSKRVHFSKQPLRTVGNLAIIKGSKKAKKKAETKIVKKPEWNDTVGDLTVHKLSKEETERRHQSIQSRNAEAARHELYEKAKSRLDTSGNLRPSPLPASGASKLTALQRALHGKELHEVLAESDKALAVVKDLFGDDPKRYVGQPNVTLAPHIVSDKKNLERTILESQSNGPCPTAMASPGGIRDDSIHEMAPKKPALNDPPSPPPELNLEDTDDTLTPDPTTPRYQPTIDLKRFQRLLEQEEPPRPSTGPSVNPLPVSSLEGEKSTTLEQGVQTVRQRGQRTDPSRLDETEVSSISQDAAAGASANHTVDSECSSLYITQPLPKQAHTDRTISGGARIDTQPLPKQAHTDRTISGGARIDTQPLPKQAHTDRTISGGARIDPQSTTRLPPPTIHPLQVVQKMPHPVQTTHRTQEGEEEEGKGSGTRVRKKSPRKAPQQETSQKDRAHGDLKVLEQLVHQLEAELKDYEQSTGYSFSVSRPTVFQAGTFSGLTASLLASVTKLARYLKQSESQLRGEIAVRGQLLHTMTEQQNLMDALTADIVKLKEKESALRSELQDLKQANSGEIRKLQEEISDLHKKMSSLVLSQTFPPPPPPPSFVHQPPMTAVSTTNAARSTVTASNVSVATTAFGSTRVPDLSISQLSNTLNASSNEWKAAPNMAQPRAQEPSAALVPHPQSLTHPHSTLTSHTHPTLTPHLHSTLTSHTHPTLTPHLQHTLHHPAPFHMTPTVQYSPAIPPSGPGVIYAQVSPLTYTDKEQMPVFPNEHSASLFSEGSQPRVNYPGLPRHNHLVPKASTTEVSPLHVVLSKSSSTLNIGNTPLTTTSFQHQPDSRSVTPQEMLAENKTLTATSTSPYAPSPPPLNVALQVPTFPTSVTGGISTSTYPSYLPQFDTISLLSSLRAGESISAHSASSSITPSQVSTSKPTGLPAADLSLLSTTQEMDTITSHGSANFPNVQASIEQMSTLAKSVLQDMEQHRQHTRLTNTKPPLQHPPATLPSTYTHLNVPATATLPNTYTHLDVPTTATLPNTYTHLNVPATATLPNTYTHLNVPATATLPNTYTHLNVPATATLPNTYTHLNVPTTATLPNIPGTWTLPSEQMLSASSQLECSKVTSTSS